MRLAILDHGAVTQGWWLNDTPLILGYDDPEKYRDDPYFLGAIVGRVANRIGGAGFDLGDAPIRLLPNEGRNQLHGGPTGFWTQRWEIGEVTRNTVRLTLHSPDGDGGFPGAVDVEVSVRLETPRLTYDIRARPDRPTPISIAQHNYYCLGDPDGIRNHRLQVPANATLALDRETVPTGDIAPVDGGPLDFRAPRSLSQAPGGVDHFFLFDADRAPGTPVAKLTAPSGLSLNVTSNQPGAQIYTGHGLGHPFAPFAGACIEPSGYPNAVNIPAFPDMIATPEHPYHQVLTLEIVETA